MAEVDLKVARTEGFEQAIELFADVAQEYLDNLHNDVRGLVQSAAPYAEMPTQIQYQVKLLEERMDSISALMDRIRNRILNTPQEVKPSTQTGESNE